MTSLEQIKRLREQTSLGINECKKALSEANGDFDSAMDILKKKGVSVMEKKSARTTSQGAIDAYVHFGGNLGALVEVNCETDFVARTEVFKKFVKDLAMHVVATNPKYVRREDVPQHEIDNQEDIDDYVKNSCLMDQLFIKDNKITIADYLRDVISQTGENVVIKRFVRFALGE